MAEILLSLTIIGVVAAITLPSLTGNINERTWNTQRKALYARFSQAIALMPALNGYGTLDDTTDTAAETFITDGLAKVLKINNICDNQHLADCGIPSRFTTMAGSIIEPFPATLVDLNSMFNGMIENGDMADVNPSGSWAYSQINTKTAAFETANGESILVFYNPNCAGNMADTEGFFAQPKMCANFIYDLNGTKGPNTVGKDIGWITAMYPSDAVIVAPMPLARHYDKASTQREAGAKCLELDSDSRLPNRDELASMFYNRELIGNFYQHYWSSSLVSSDEAWLQYMNTGRHFPYSRDSLSVVRCVKR